VLVAIVNGIAAAPFLIVVMIISRNRPLMSENRNGNLAVVLGYRRTDDRSRRHRAPLTDRSVILWAGAPGPWHSGAAAAGMSTAITVPAPVIPRADMPFAW
jgi:hypothetical protein